MEKATHNTRHAALIGFVLAVAVFVVYAQTFGFGLVNYDDGSYVANNPAVRTGLSLENIKWAFTTHHAANWHPLTWISLQLDATLFGENYGWYHATNVTLHAATTVMLFVLLLRTTGAMWRSAAVAALFALHPAHVESVAWVTERKDVLSGALGLAALLAYVEYARKPGAARLALVTLLLALGLLAKGMLVTWPAVMLLMDVWPLRRVGSDPVQPPSAFSRATPLGLVKEKIPLILLVIAASVATFVAQNAGGATVEVARIPIADRLASAVVGVVRYMGLMFWPADLSPFYPLQQWAMWQVLGSCALLTAITAVAWTLRRDRPYMLMGWLWFVGTLVPVIGLVQVGGQSLADRYCYIPHIGLAIAIVWGVADVRALAPFRPQIGAVACMVLIGLGIGAARQARYWRDSVSLWTHALAVTRDNFPAERNLGFEYARLNQPELARPHLENAAKLAPHMADVQTGAGMFLVDMSRPVEAIPYLRAASELKPADAEARAHLAIAHNSAGVVFARKGDFAVAASHFAEAVRLNPQMIDARDNLARARQMLGQSTQPSP